MSINLNGSNVIKIRETLQEKVDKLNNDLYYIPTYTNKSDIDKRVMKTRLQITIDRLDQAKYEEASFMIDKFKLI